MQFKYARRWYKIWIFYNHFCLIFTSLEKQILPASILDNCAYKIVGKQILDYLDDHLFDFDEN